MSLARRAVIRAIMALSGWPSSAPVTGNGSLLTLTTPDGPSFLNGHRAVARFAPGITGRFTFIRERFPIAGSGSQGNSATYVRADRTGVPSSVAPALTASADPAAPVNFVGVQAVGRRVDLSLGAGLTGDLSIFTAASAAPAVAVGGGRTSTSYVIRFGDALPVTALAENIVASDADKVIQAEATALAFTAGLSPAADPDATLSFYGPGTVGSTVVAQCIAGSTGTLRILRADGSSAVSAAAVATLQYTVQAGDAPLKAVLSDMVYTVVVPTASGLGAAVSGFLTVEYDSASPATRSLNQGDIYKARLPPGVTGAYTWSVAGVAQSDPRYPGVTVSAQLNAASFQTAHPGDGPVSVSVSQLTFLSNGIYAEAPAQSATGAPFLYSIDVQDSARSVIRLGYLPLANLDPASLPAPSDYPLGNTSATVASVALDNSSTDLKYVLLNLSAPLAPADFVSPPTVGYTGASVRYPGGQPAATFAGLSVTTDMPLPLPLAWPQRGEGPATVNAGEIFVSSNFIAQGYGDAGFHGLTLVTYQDELKDYSADDECSVQMSILPDWGTDTSVLRFVALHVRPNPDGLNDMTYQLRRRGNTISYVEHVFDGQDVDAWSGFTFANPGPLCLAKLVRHNPSRLVQVETSENGGNTWTVRHVGTLTTEGVRAKCGSNQSDIPVTGVGFIGFTAIPS